MVSNPIDRVAVNRNCFPGSTPRLAPEFCPTTSSTRSTSSPTSWARTSRSCRTTFPQVAQTFFCIPGLPLARTRWVRLTFSSHSPLSSKQHCWLTSATSIIFHFNELREWWESNSELQPGAAGWEASMLPLSSSAPFPVKQTLTKQKGKWWPSLPIHQDQSSEWHWVRLWQPFTVFQQKRQLV